MSTIPSGIKTGWWSFELPQYRPHPTPSTYSLFAYEDLPPIRERLDGDFQWLKSQPAKVRSLTEGCYSDGSKPDLTKLSAIVTPLSVNVPESFMTFIQSPDLHARIRSCTDCYLDVADYAVKTKEITDGYLIHFLSDSQWCVHWYIHLNSSGQECVIASLNAYGFEFEDLRTKDETDLTREDVWFCAPTFIEFIYRFWLENEIWFALAWDKRPLTALEQVYVDHYLKLAK
jgi:hypothetical protein